VLFINIGCTLQEHHKSWQKSVKSIAWRFVFSFWPTVVVVVVRLSFVCPSQMYCG